MCQGKTDLDKMASEMPKWFPQTYMYGCGEGWHPLIRQACEKIAALDPPDFRFLQIKEKFGGLRLYATGNTGEHTREIYQILSEAEEASWYVCEACGATEGVETRAGKYGWVKTYCPKCHEER